MQTTDHFWSRVSIGHTWGLSAKWASQRLQCTPDGIIHGCRGDCCLRSFWSVIKVNKILPGNACPLLSQTTHCCSFSLKTRPVICMLFPFVPNEHSKLCLHGRCLMGCCKPNRTKTGPTILECQEPQLTALFGRVIYKQMEAGVTSGKDITFEVPDIVINALQEERFRIQHNILPVSRQEMAQAWVSKHP